MNIKIFKHYKKSDDQTDIFGPDIWPVVKDLHNKSARQMKSLVPLMGQYVLSRLTRRKIQLNSARLKNYSLAIDPQQGRFIYNCVLSKAPTCIVEYGTSFGISTIYAAKALQKLGRGQIIGSEIERTKIKIAKDNLQKCHLMSHVDIKEGDVLKSLSHLDQPIDMLIMDGFPDLNLAVLQLLEPNLAPYCLILTDDAYLFHYEMQAYLAYLSTSECYSHQILPISDGMGLSVKIK